MTLGHLLAFWGGGSVVVALAVGWIIAVGANPDD